MTDYSLAREKAPIGFPHALTERESDALAAIEACQGVYGVRVPNPDAHEIRELVRRGLIERSPHGLFKTKGRV